ncbi:MAG: hypothetical protein ACOYVK_20000 [Bacillota bacterium]
MGVLVYLFEQIWKTFVDNAIVGARIARPVLLKGKTMELSPWRSGRNGRISCGRPMGAPTFNGEQKKKTSFNGKNFLKTLSRCKEVESYLFI